MKKIFTLASIFFIQNSFAQTSIPLTIGVPYQQDFNTLIASGNANWADTVTLGGWYADGFAQTLYADDGSDVFGGRLHSYGSTNSNERALGGKSFSSLSGISFAVRMKNSSNNTINYFQIGFRGEQWRQNTNNLSLKFYYQINASSITTGTWIPITSLDFPSLHSGNALALDGNLGANDTSFLLALPLTLTAGQEVWFKWELIGNSSSPGLAIDDLEIIPYASNPTDVSSWSSQNDDVFAFYSESSGSIILNTNLSKEDLFSICLYDTYGKNVCGFSEKISLGKNQSAFYAGNLSKGIYIVVIHSSQKHIAQKIITK